jgi:hypothetical protein
MISCPQARLSLVAFSFFLFPFSLAAAEVPTPAQDTQPGMERGPWNVESWGNPGAAEKAASGGFALLKLSFTGGPKDKVVFKHPTMLGVAQAGKVRLHVFAPDENGPFFTLALCTGPASQWHEAHPVQLRKGWNKLEFAVSAREWKTEASAWKHTAAVEHSDDVRAVCLVVYNRLATGAIFVAGLTYDLDAAGERIAALIEDLRSPDRAQREQAEEGLRACGRQVLEPLSQLGDSERPEVLIRAACVLRDLQPQMNTDEHR